MQYKPKEGGRWRDYPGKDKMKISVSKCDFRLLNHNKTKVLVEKGSYSAILKRFRQIEFFKHR